MLIAADRRQSLSTIPVNELVNYLTGENQHTFVRLRLALGMNLRRQLLIAVCDDLALRNAMAEKLAHDLPRLQDLSSFIPLELGIAGRSVKPQAQDNLLTLTLHPQEATGLSQVFQQLNREAHQPRFGVQIVGIEHLTREPVHIQRAFLNHLRSLGRNFVHLDSNLVLWVTRPWWRSIQQSAPEFWRWRTGVFEFEGDPLPATAVISHPAITEPPTSRPAPIAAATVPAAALLPTIQTAIDRLSEPAVPAVEPVAEPVLEPVAAAIVKPLDVPVEPLLDPAPSLAAAPSVGLFAEPADAPVFTPAVVEPVVAFAEPVAEPIAEPIAEPVVAFAEPVAEPIAEPPLAPVEPATVPIVTPILEQQPLEAWLAKPVESDDVESDSIKSDSIKSDRAAAVADQAALLTLEPVAVVAAPIDIPADQDHLEPSQEELDLADLVLAAVMQQVSRQPEMLQQSDTPNLDHPSFEPIRILQQVEDLQQQAAGSAEFAGVYRQLGDYYRNQHDVMLQKDPEFAGKHLHVGIKAYDLAWKFLPIEDAAIAEIHNDIANLYWMLSRTPGELEQSLAHLQAGIERYQLAIDRLDAVAHPYTCAMLHNNLGAAYSDLALRRDPVDCLVQSIAAYQTALQHRPAAADPRRYAATQNNLGTAYWNLGQHQSLVLNLRRSVTAYTEALKIYDPESEPLHYAMIQNNLGTAYWNLAQCDLDSDNPEEALDAMPEDLLRLAIGAYRVALIYRTRELAPNAHAATQNNLGTAYWHLANQPSTHPGEVQSYVLQAITAYEMAIASAATVPNPLSFDLAATHNNLAAAYHQAATNRQAQLDQNTQHVYLDAALQNHVSALEGWEEGSELYEAALNGLTQVIRGIHEHQGSPGQTQALSKLPTTVMMKVMKLL
jgi:tetratricopeptide (TPR) repeat protein